MKVIYDKSKIKKELSADKILQILESFKDLNVLLIGDTVIDEYVFTKPYGMASKSSVIATKYIRTESHAGGILAVANHLSNLCKKITVLTVLGVQNTKKEIIESSLNKNIVPKFFYKKEAPTVTKRRYLGHFMNTKLMELSFFDEKPITPDLENEIIREFDSIHKQYDLILIVDFGHGFITDQMASRISSTNIFTAINAQTNSINYGYNMVTKYDHADYVCIDEQELRLAYRDKHTDVDKLLAKLTNDMHTALSTVTLGTQGATVYEKTGTFTSFPALSLELVDSTGSGDAFLSTSSLCAMTGQEPEVVCLLGNIAGGIATTHIGNSEAINKSIIMETFKTYIK